MKVYSVKGKGLPFVYAAHKNRVGLLVGLGLFTVIILLSSLFVWDIKIVSDTSISHNEILANLKSLGCYEGSFVPSMDFEDLCIDYVNKYDDCAWVSVNLRGTVAYVEILDRDIHEELTDTPRNLVASHSGIIEYYSVYSGKSHVLSGSVVKKGDLLVSGIVENKKGAVRLCRAEAEVFATVDVTLCVEVPYNYKKQVYTGNIFEKKALRFFNLSLPLFSNKPDQDIQCTTSYQSNGAVLFDEIELPLSIEKEIYKEYNIEDFTYTQSEAEEVAQRKMQEKYASELPGAQLISVLSKGEHLKDKYILTCKIKCRMDITEPLDIYS